MKRFLYLIPIFVLASCNLPASQAVTSETPTFTPTSVIATATSEAATLEPAFTETSIPPTSTPTQIPCDPLTTDYCITAGHLLFQRPIQPPDNDKVDLTYLYASNANGKRDPHHGVEFQNPYGTPVHAAGDGTVVFADSDKADKFSPWNNFYGNVIIIRHSGELYTLYAHLSVILVVEGQEVKAGDVIGQVGQSGGATGAHLHLEVRKGPDYKDYFSTENPELWLLPSQGTGAMSITFHASFEQNYPRPLVISRYAEGSDDIVFTYYINAYVKGFEHNAEDAGLSNLPQGRYKIAFNDSSGLKERTVFIEAGKLTEVYFEVK